MTDLMRSINDAPTSLSRKDTESDIDIKNLNAGFVQNEKIKQLRTSTTITDEQRETQKPMIVNNTDDMGKIEKH